MAKKILVLGGTGAMGVYLPLDLSIGLKYELVSDDDYVSIIAGEDDLQCAKHVR